MTEEEWKDRYFSDACAKEAGKGPMADAPDLSSEGYESFLVDELNRRGAVLRRAMKTLEAIVKDVAPICDEGRAWYENALADLRGHVASLVGEPTRSCELGTYQCKHEMGCPFMGECETGRKAIAEIARIREEEERREKEIMDEFSLPF